MSTRLCLVSEAITNLVEDLLPPQSILFPTICIANATLQFRREVSHKALCANTAASQYAIQLDLLIKQ